MIPMRSREIMEMTKSSRGSVIDPHQLLEIKSWLSISECLKWKWGVRSKKRKGNSCFSY
jgi:hypothetical protein